jgi:hypothetical protein
MEMKNASRFFGKSNERSVFGRQLHREAVNVNEFYISKK